MGLSDYKGDKAFDVVEGLIVPVINIVSDDGFKDAVDSGADGVAHFVLGKHRDDTVAFLAAYFGKDPSEYRAESTPSSVMVDTMRVLTDKDILGFLTQLGEEFGITSADIAEGPAQTS